MLHTFGIIGATSIWHWAIVLVIALLLFGGRGKIPALMKDLGKGITSFKKGLKDDSAEDENKVIEEPEGKATDKPADK